MAEKYGGDIPKTGDEMCKALPGVGRKMAVLTVNIAWNTNVGIGASLTSLRIGNVHKEVGKQSSVLRTVQRDSIFVSVVLHGKFRSV